MKSFLIAIVLVLFISLAAVPTARPQVISSQRGHAVQDGVQHGCRRRGAACLGLLTSDTRPQTRERLDYMAA